MNDLDPDSKKPDGRFLMTKKEYSDNAPTFEAG
jgi:hypothetical protein